MILVFMTFLSSLTVSASETSVYCVYYEDCILPCHFPGGDDVVIQYVYSENISVHSFYQNQDQLDFQNLQFSNRTSLFKHDIHKGNASLLLREVMIDDEGQYTCSVSALTGRESSIINLRVDVPVSEVSISPEGDRITCSSDRIYPEPELTWSIISPLNTTVLHTYTTRPTGSQLHSIYSSLTLLNSSADLIYSCTVRTRSSQRTAVLRQQTTNGRCKTIPCTESDVSVTELVWRFNHSQVILTRPQGHTSYDVSEEWRKHVAELSGSGSLTLQDLSAEQAGVYSCDIGHEETVILLRVTPDKPSVNRSIIFGVTVVVLFVAAGVLLVLCCKKIKNKNLAF